MLRVEIRDETHVLGRPVGNGRGRRMGRTVAMDCGPDCAPQPSTAARLVAGELNAFYAQVAR